MSLKEISAGTQDKNLEEGTKIETIEERCLPA